MVSLGESEGIPQKKLKIRCQETEFGGISANQTVLLTVFLPSWLTSAVAKPTI